MKEGMELQEKYTKLECIVESVHPTHILVTFKESGLMQIIHQNQYKHYIKGEHEKA